MTSKQRVISPSLVREMFQLGASREELADAFGLSLHAIVTALQMTEPKDYFERCRLNHAAADAHNDYYNRLPNQGWGQEGSQA
jgi:hypothetical protein